MLDLKTVAVAATLLACGCAPAAAGAMATEKATLKASFTPDRLGASTTIGFSFTVSTTEGLAPPPLTGIDLHMPAGLNYTDTNLGLAICQPENLQREGLAGCPANSRLGSGSAYVEVPFGDGAGQELPEVQAVMGPPNNGNIVVLFYANGKTPVSAQLVFTGEVQPASGIFGSQLFDRGAGHPQRPQRAQRLRHQRQSHDRPRRRDLLQARPRQARVIPSDRYRRAGTLPSRRLPVLGLVHVRRRFHHEYLGEGSLSCIAQQQAQEEVASIVTSLDCGSSGAPRFLSGGAVCIGGARPAATAARRGGHRAPGHSDATSRSRPAAGAPCAARRSRRAARSPRRGCTAAPSPAAG